MVFFSYNHTHFGVARLDLGSKPTALLLQGGPGAAPRGGNPGRRARVAPGEQLGSPGTGPSLAKLPRVRLCGCDRTNPE